MPRDAWLAVLLAVLVGLPTRLSEPLDFIDVCAKTAKANIVGGLRRPPSGRRHCTVSAETPSNSKTVSPVRGGDNPRPAPSECAWGAQDRPPASAAACGYRCEDTGHRFLHPRLP